VLRIARLSRGAAVSGAIGLGPWLALAGIGALHGLNPATAWALVAAWRWRGGARATAWRALLPIAVGHVAAVALVALLAVVGLVAQRGVLPWLAGGMSVFVAAVHVSGRLPCGLRHAGLALCSFAVATAQGVGMMLVPALIPLCVASSPARAITASGSMGLALAAVGLHLVAMLAATCATVGLVALVASRGPLARRVAGHAAARLCGLRRAWGSSTWRPHRRTLRSAPHASAGDP